MIKSSFTRLIGPVTSTLVKCIGCNRDITEPGLCRTGKVLQSSEVRTKLLTDKWEGLTTIRSFVPVIKYAKGTLCDKCAACYHNVLIGKELHPIVKVDPLHGLPKPRDQKEGKRAWKVLNTKDHSIGGLT